MRRQILRMPDQVVRETYEPEAYVIAAVVQGNWERALELIDEFGPSPAYAPHFAGVAVRLLAAKRRPEAVRVASRAVELDDECADAHSVLGRSLLEELKQSAAQAGDEQAAATAARAETALRRATLLAPEALHSRIALAGLYTDQNRLFEAAHLIEEAFSLDSRGPDAREALKRLRKAVETASKQRDGSKSCVSHPNTSGGGVIPGRHDLTRLGDELRRLAARLHQPTDAARTPSVSLCLITRDEARNLPRVIE